MEFSELFFPSYLFLHYFNYKKTLEGLLHSISPFPPPPPPRWPKRLRVRVERAKSKCNYLVYLNQLVVVETITEMRHCNNATVLTDREV